MPSNPAPDTEHAPDTLPAETLRAGVWRLGDWQLA
jgi:hypothetical protein